jgi:hypothetical protein
MLPSIIKSDQKTGMLSHHLDFETLSPMANLLLGVLVSLFAGRAHLYFCLL